MVLSFLPHPLDHAFQHAVIVFHPVDLADDFEVVVEVEPDGEFEAGGRVNYFPFHMKGLRWPRATATRLSYVAKVSTTRCC